MNPKRATGCIIDHILATETKTLEAPFILFIAYGRGMTIMGIPVLPSWV